MIDRDVKLEDCIEVRNVPLRNELEGHVRGLYRRKWLVVREFVSSSGECAPVVRPIPERWAFW
jgi:hypothetical protein